LRPAVDKRPAPGFDGGLSDNVGSLDGEQVAMKQRSMSKNTRRLRWAAFALAACSAAASAQNLPVPGDCGAGGNRACPIGAPAAPIGEPAAPVGTPAQGVGAYGGAPAYGGGGAYEPPGAAAGQTAPPDNGFSWQQRNPDGTLQTCRRGLDGVTVRCDDPNQAAQPAAR